MKLNYVSVINILILYCSTPPIPVHRCTQLLYSHAPLYTVAVFPCTAVHSCCVPVHRCTQLLYSRARYGVWEYSMKYGNTVCGMRYAGALFPCTAVHTCCIPVLGMQYGNTACGMRYAGALFPCTAVRCRCTDRSTARLRGRRTWCVGCTQGFTYWCCVRTREGCSE